MTTASTRLHLPRLPVLSWESVAIRVRSAPLPAVTDERACVFVSSGRAAIFLALESLGVGPGDRVLVPTYHCPTMIAPITRLGATPVFYPITASGAPDLAWLAALDTRDVKALIAAHFFGLPQPMPGAKRFCAARGIALVEDCAHAFFGASGGTPVGVSGDFAIASLPKFFPVVEGGCLIGHADLIRRVGISDASPVAELRAALDSVEIGASYGRFGILGRAVNSLTSLKRRLRSPRGDALRSEDEGDAVDQGSWLDERLLHTRATAITRWTVRHCDSARLIERRRANYALWLRALEGVAGARALFGTLPEAAVPYVFPLWVDDPERRYHAFRAAGVPVFRWDVAWPGVPIIPGDPGIDWQTKVFQLGCHQDLSAADIAQLAAVARRLLES